MGLLQIIHSNRLGFASCYGRDLILPGIDSFCKFMTLKILGNLEGIWRLQHPEVLWEVLLLLSVADLVICQVVAHKERKRNRISQQPWSKLFQETRSRICLISRICLRISTLLFPSSILFLLVFGSWKDGIMVEKGYRKRNPHSGQMSVSGLLNQIITVLK